MHLVKSRTTVIKQISRSMAQDKPLVDLTHRVAIHPDTAVFCEVAKSLFDNVGDAAQVHFERDEAGPDDSGKPPSKKLAGTS